MGTGCSVAAEELAAEAAINAAVSSPKTSLQVPQVSGTSSTQPVLTTIYTKWNIGEVFVKDLNEKALVELQAATFEDKRWEGALAHLESSGAWQSPHDLEQLVRRGAKAFGFWHLPDAALQVLTCHLRGGGRTGAATPALAERLRSLPEAVAAAERPPLAPRAASRSQSQLQRMTRKATGLVGAPGAPAANGTAAGSRVELLRAKLLISGSVVVLCGGYTYEVCAIMYPGVLDVLGWPVATARAGGMGTLIWTALLILSMSRTFIKLVSRFLPIRSCLFELLDHHKELHIFFGQAMFVTAAVHVVSHAVGTVPGILSHSLEEVNGLLGCANPDTTPMYIGGAIEWLQLAPCPLKEKPTYLSTLYGTTPGLTGVALVCLAALIGFTANAVRRRTRFEWFIYVHQFGVPLWLVLLFVHGSAGWIGIGLPLVTFVCSLPAALYLTDRVLRLLRYYLFTGGSVRVVDVVIRPGSGRRARGSLINLKLSKPPFLWNFREGMYAFLCMPEYSKFQWHPFTVCSGKDEDTVDFIISACGDWTDALAERCLEAHRCKGSLPIIALDGPFLAPTASALSHELLVAVGAGVGITPFLSLLSTIIATLGRHTETGGSLPLKEAHFFWMTRSADELLFGRRQFARIVTDPTLRDKVFLHLHVTQTEPEKDVCAYLFREAVRRQSRTDREAYRKATAAVPDVAAVSGGLQLPHCWVQGVQQDVLWVDSLLESEDAEAAVQLAAAHQDHWAQGLAARQERQTSGTNSDASASGGGHGALGLFTRTQSLSYCSSLKSGMGSKFSRQSGGSSGSNGNGLTEGTAPEAASTGAPAGFANYLPVVFGRPNFASEIGAIGMANPNLNVNVFVCGNDALVQNLKEVCSSCSQAAKASRPKTKSRVQDFVLHFERFG